MSENSVTLVGNLTEDPELRFTAGGLSICKLRLAVNRRKKKGNEWETETSFFDATVWAELGENAAESLRKGMRVIVSGSLEQRSWEKDGVKRSVVEVRVDAVGPDLRWATAEVKRTERKASPQQAKNEPPAYDDDSLSPF